MLEAVGPGSGPSHRIERPGGADQTQRAASALATPAAGVYEIPAFPPHDLLSELDRAASVIDELAARQVGVHFAIDDRTGKVRVQVVDDKGALIREIPATRMLDVLSSGSASGLAFNAIG
jgi:flagellar protein FlaG